MNFFSLPDKQKMHDRVAGNRKIDLGRQTLKVVRKCEKYEFYLITVKFPVLQTKRNTEVLFSENWSRCMWSWHLIDPQKICLFMFFLRGGVYFNFIVLAATNRKQRSTRKYTDSIMMTHCTTELKQTWRVCKSKTWLPLASFKTFFQASIGSTYMSDSRQTFKWIKTCVNFLQACG